MTGWNCDRKAARWSEPAHYREANCCCPHGTQARNQIRGLTSNLHRCAPTGWPVLQALSVVARQCWDGCRKSPCRIEIQLANDCSGLSVTRILQAVAAQSLPSVRWRSRHETVVHLIAVPATPASHAIDCDPPDGCMPRGCCIPLMGGRGTLRAICGLLGRPASGPRIGR